MTAERASASKAEPGKPLSWFVLACGLLALNIGLGALMGKHPSDLYWITLPAAQVGVMAALVLALVVPGFAFMRAFFKRLSDLNTLPAAGAVAAHLGLGCVATIGSMLGRTVTGHPPFSNALEAAIVLFVQTIVAALIFLLTARLFFHRNARTKTHATDNIVETSHG